MGINPTWEMISTWTERSEKILIKKLSNNDCSWADKPGNHQSGFYIPVSTKGFFPDLSNTNPEKPHIFDARFLTIWPVTSEIKNSALKHFSNKGSEFHCTRLPKEQFSGLTPASLLIAGKLSTPVNNAHYWLAVVDSSSEEAEIIETLLSLESDFQVGIFEPGSFKTALEHEEKLISELRQHLVNGTLRSFINSQRMPETSALAAAAQASWLKVSGCKSLNPFEISEPGDAVMRISRDIEFQLYKQAELRKHVGEIARLLLSDGDPIFNLVHGFGTMYSTFLSASQSRKSRGGRSFEIHIKRLLVDGNILHKEQAILDKRRPDFAMPSVSALKNPEENEALILSLKTTLRERWKQLGLELKHAAVFLATVDDRITDSAIKDMEANEIIVVVPESLKLKKRMKKARYTDNTNVITFRDFFDNEIRLKRPSLIRGC